MEKEAGAASAVGAQRPDVPRSNMEFIAISPMLPMNYGCITISLETGVPILPIYLHFAEDVCRLEINEPFQPGKDKTA